MEECSYGASVLKSLAGSLKGISIGNEIVVHGKGKHCSVRAILKNSVNISVRWKVLERTGSEQR